QPQAQPPAQQPEQPPAKGEILKPTFTIGDQGGTLPRPRAAVTDKAGNIYIYTEIDSKIHKYDSGGKQLTSWDVRSVTNEKLIEGSAIIIQGDQVYVLDAATSDLI